LSINRRAFNELACFAFAASIENFGKIKNEVITLEMQIRPLLHCRSFQGTDCKYMPSFTPFPEENGNERCPFVDRS
jgi:hypothetical protein